MVKYFCEKPAPMSSEGGVFDAIAELPWGLIFVLGTLGLVRPALSILGFSEGLPAVPVAITILLSAIWISVVVIRRAPHPIATLMAVGVSNAVLALALNVALAGGFSRLPRGILSILLTNLIWGTILGLLAFGIIYLIDRSAAENRGL